jgi:hypothetical protein
LLTVDKDRSDFARLAVGTSACGTTDIYAAERMITDEFIPDRKYLEQCFQDLGVRDIFVGPGRKFNAYVVTGLRTAHDATKATEMMKRKSVHARAGVDASASGLPLSLGLDGHGTSSVAETSTADKSDFVFGFRLRRLRYKKGDLSPRDSKRVPNLGLAGPATWTMTMSKNLMPKTLKLRTW